MFVEEKARKQSEPMSPANMPFLSPERSRSSGFFLACQSTQRPQEKIKLSTIFLPPIYPCFSACLP